MRPHFAQAVDREQVAAGRIGLRAALAPHREQIQQPRRHLAEQRIRLRVAAEDLARGLVDEADAVLLVDDDEALAQPLDDVLREFREVREVEVALAHQRLALAQPAGERRDRERGDEDDAAEQARLGQVGGIGLPRNHSMICWPSTHSAAIAAIVVAMRLRQQEADAGDRHDEQQARAARGAAARDQQRRHRDDVEGDVDEGLGLQARPARLQQPDADDAGREPADEQHRNRASATPRRVICGRVASRASATSTDGTASR